MQEGGVVPQGRGLRFEGRRWSGHESIGLKPGELSMLFG